MPQIFWIIVTISTCLALILILFLVVQGYRDGVQRSEAQKRQQVAILLQHAADLWDEGRRQEALVAYQQVLELDAQNQVARNGINAAQAAPEMPTPMATPSATATAAPNPIEIVWADALALYSAGRWQEAIDRMVQARATQSDFRTQELEEMLFTAYVGLGREKTTNADSLEEAVQLFDKALELRPNAAQIWAVRDMTAQYIDVLTSWAADWPRVIALLEDLHQRDPGYRDVRPRLQTAYIEHGKSLARQEKWCMAADEYANAIAMLDWMDLRIRRDELTGLCEESKKNPEEGTDRSEDSRDLAGGNFALVGLKS